MDTVIIGTLWTEVACEQKLVLLYVVFAGGLCKSGKIEIHTGLITCEPGSNGHTTRPSDSVSTDSFTRREWSFDGRCVFLNLEP